MSPSSLPLRLPSVPRTSWTRKNPSAASAGIKASLCRNFSRRTTSCPSGRSRRDLLFVPALVEQQHPIDVQQDGEGVLQPVDAEDERRALAHHVRRRRLLAARQ